MILNLSFKRKNIFRIIRRRNKVTFLTDCGVVQFDIAYYEFVMETPSTLPQILFVLHGDAWLLLYFFEK